VADASHRTQPCCSLDTSPHGRWRVGRASDGAKAAGCEYLHVDFEDDLSDFYYGAGGFTPTSAGLLSLG
jgi:hypothetical protein